MKSGATETSFYYLSKYLNISEDVDIVRTTEECVRSNKQYKIIWAHDNCDQMVHRDLPQYIDHVDMIVCPSKWEMEEYIRYNRAPANKLTVISNGVDKMFSPTPQRKSKTAIFFSAPHKGIVPLPKIWKNVIKYHPDAKLKVFSSTCLYENSGGNIEMESPEIVQAIDELKNLPNVYYSPCIHRESLLEHIQDAAFFVHPNVWEETFCVSMAEAMACGCYPVVSNIGALPEVSFGRGRYVRMSGKKTNTGWIVDEQFIDEFSHTLINCFRYFDVEPKTFYNATRDLSLMTRRLYDWQSLSRAWGNMIESIINTKNMKI